VGHPVLFLRTDETRLFAIRGPDSGAPSPSGQPPPEQAQRESTLNGLYMQALAAMRTGRPADAITLLDSLLALEPGYKDAAQRRDAARITQRSAASYQRGRAAEDAGNWDSAVAEYTVVTDTDPDYRDASARLAHCGKHQQIVRLQEELRIHVHASEWQAVIAVGDELTGLGVRSAEFDRAVKTARQQVRREEASRAELEQAEGHGFAAGLAAVAGGRLRREQPAEGAAPVRPQDESGFVEGKTRILYASDFPLLGSIIISAPLFILAMERLLIIPITTPAPYWVVILLGLTGIAGSAIDYRNGCGISAVAVGVNSALLSGYAVLVMAERYQWLGSTNQFLLLLCAVTGIGVIANGVILVCMLRSFPNRRGRMIDKPLLVFLVFMASGLALLFTASALTFLSRITPAGYRSLIWVAGLTFLAALLAELTGIGIAVARVFQTRSGRRELGTLADLTGLLRYLADATSHYR